MVEIEGRRNVIAGLVPVIGEPQEGRMEREERGVNEGYQRDKQHDRAGAHSGFIRH